MSILLDTKFFKRNSILKEKSGIIITILGKGLLAVFKVETIN